MNPRELLMRLWMLALAGLSAPALSACVADGPLQTAQWIHGHARDFAFATTGEPRNARRAFLSSRLHALLEGEWICQNVSESLCRLHTDPWLASERLRELQPPRFEVEDGAGNPVHVYVWLRVQDADGVVSTREARLHLIHDDSSGCWLLDDLVAGGQSLRQLLEN